MDRLQELMTFMDGLASDIRLKPTHVSLCLALCHAWVRSDFQNVFQVSRSKLMAASRIESRATYHKVMKDLQAFGYLKYTHFYIIISFLNLANNGTGTEGSAWHSEDLENSI